MEIASKHTEAQGLGSGVRMEEGLFLHRVKLKGGDVPPRDLEFPILIEPHTANAVFPGRDLAAMTAGETPNPRVGHGFPQLTTPCFFAEDFFEGRFGHDDIGHKVQTLRTVVK
jgi:hypothetical protein